MQTKTVYLNFNWLALLGVILIVLKLVKFHSWSWFWVLSPFWIPLAIFAVIMVGIGLFVLGAWLLDKRHDKKRAKLRRKK